MIQAEPTAPPLLAIRDLGVSFTLGGGRTVRAVDGLSLTVHAGQTLALVGESGCGKSVTALSVLKLLPRPTGRVDRGSVLLEGRDLVPCSDAAMLKVRGREVAMIFQEPMTSLNPVRRIGDQIIEAIRLHQHVDRRTARGLAEAAMTEVGIGNAARRLDDFPHQFSGGMRQRVMIAMALACRPKLLVADEPTTALDVTIQAQILDLLRRLQRAHHMGVLLITHDLLVVGEVADVVCVVYDGRVMEYAPTSRLFQRCHHPYTRGLFGCIPRLGRRAPRLATVDDFVTDPSQYKNIPGASFGVEPWWSGRPAPPELLPDDPDGGYRLHEVEPNHWVGCWATPFVRDHPNRAPDIGVTKDRGS